MIGRLSKSSKPCEFSGIRDSRQSWTRAYYPCRIRGVRKECLQFPLKKRKGIHKAVERIKILNKAAPFQLLLFLQTTPGEKISVSTILSIRCLIPGRTRVLVPHSQGNGLGHQQHREFLAGCACMQGSNEKLSIPAIQSEFKY